MRLRRFEAATVTEALAQVKADMGPEAVILHARTTGPTHEGGRVEVTAAVDDDAPRASGRGACRINPEDASPLCHGAVPPVPEATNGPSLLRGGPDPLRSGEPEPRETLEEIHQMVRELRAEEASPVKVPMPLRPAYRHLLSQDVPATLARRHVLTLPVGGRPRGGTASLAPLHDMLARKLRVSGPIVPGKQRRVVTLVGPTGVGKTTTIAKLAGQLRRVQGLAIGLISLDTYRIGAVAQMRIYADLLGVPLHVVRTPAELQAALRAEHGADLLLVDTTGRSPHHAEGISAIRRLLSEIPDLEVHLTVSATTKGSDLTEILRRFRPLGYRRVLVTKIDEARTLGPLLSLALERELVISYLGTGQEVPDDLETATPRRLAGLLVPGAAPRQGRRAPHF